MDQPAPKPPAGKLTTVKGTKMKGKGPALPQPPAVTIHLPPSSVRIHLPPAARTLTDAKSTVAELVARNGGKLVDPTLFDGLMAARASRTAATAGQLQAGAAAITLVADLAREIALLTAAEGRKDAPAYKAVAAGERARQQVWAASGIPPALRSLGSTTSGHGLNETTDRLQTEHDEELEKQGVERKAAFQKGLKAKMTPEYVKRFGIAAPVPGGGQPPERQDADGIVGLAARATGAVGSGVGGGVEALAGEASGGLTGSSFGAVGGILNGVQARLTIDDAINRISQGGAVGKQGRYDLASGIHDGVDAAGTISGAGVSMGEHAHTLAGAAAKAEGLKAVGFALGGVLSVLSAARSIAEMGAQISRQGGADDLATKVREEDGVLAEAGVGQRDVHAFKAAISGGEAIGSTISAIGQFLGPTPAGPILALLGTIINASVSVGELLKESDTADAVLEQLMVARYDAEASEVAAKWLLRNGTSFRLDEFIKKARQDHPDVLKMFAKQYDITGDDLMKLSDRELRELLASKTRESLDQRAVWTKISDRFKVSGPTLGSSGDVAGRNAMAKDIMEGRKGAERRDAGWAQAKGLFRSNASTDEARRQLREIFEMQLAQGGKNGKGVPYTDAERKEIRSLLDDEDNRQRDLAREQQTNDVGISKPENTAANLRRFREDEVMFRAKDGSFELFASENVQTRERSRGDAPLPAGRS